VRALHRDSFVALAVGHYAPTQIAAHDALIADLAYAADPALSHVMLAEAPASDGSCCALISMPSRFS